MILADSGVSFQAVAAFTGPLLIGMGFVGGVVAWIIRSASKLIETRIQTIATIWGERQKAMEDRFTAQQDQIRDLAAGLTQALTQLNSTAQAVARIEGRLLGGSKP